MPWQETNPVLERHHFVQDLDSGQWTMTELCERYGISRNTCYTWAHRYQQHGVFVLHNRSAQKSSPRAHPQTPSRAFSRSTRALAGARKILKRLCTRRPKGEWPARGTIFDILARHDRVRHRRLRTHWKHPGAIPGRAVLRQSTESNP